MNMDNDEKFIEGLTDSDRERMQQWQYYSYWKRQVKRLNDTLDLDIYSLPIIAMQLYDAMDERKGHRYAWLANKSYEALLLVLDEWTPFNGSDGFGGSLIEDYG